MVDPKVDELSMMTYLSQYPNAKIKPGTPLKPRTNPNRVRCYGKGSNYLSNQIIISKPVQYFRPSFFSNT